MKKIIICLFLILAGCQVEDYIEKKIEEEIEDKVNKTPEKKLWENGIVYYSISDQFTTSEKECIYFSMQLWENKTSIIFLEEHNKYMVNIHKTDRNRATIGQQENSFIWLIDNAEQKDIVHELGHVLGLEHEHQRDDRNDYIIILWENIVESKYEKFYFFDKDILYNMMDYEYDIESIMHYPFNACSSSGEQTIKYLFSKDGYFSTKSKPSELDYKKINDMYN